MHRTTYDQQILSHLRGVAMEKPIATYHEVELPTLVADEKPTGIKRKPLATPAQAHNPSPQTQAQESHKEYEARALPPRGYLPTQNRSITHRTHARWSALKRRTRILILVALVCLVALIIGLAAGLASRSRVQNLPLPSSHGGPYNGDLTYYDPALGACGFTNSGSDAIVAVSHLVFDAVSAGSNPNANPLCGKKIRAKRGNKSIDLTVVDRCTGCQPTDIDVTRSVFSDLASIDEGRVPVSWSWLENVPAAASG